MSLFLHELHIIYRYNFLNNSYSSFQLTTRAGHHTWHHRSLACMTVRVCHGTRVSRYAREVRRGVNMTLYCDYILKLNNCFFFRTFSFICLFHVSFYCSVCISEENYKKAVCKLLPKLLILDG